MVRKSKPEAKPARTRSTPFGAGILPELEPLRPERRMPYTHADLQWAAEEFGQNTRDYDLVNLPPISGGAPRIDELAALDLPDAFGWPEWSDADRWELGEATAPGRLTDDPEWHKAMDIQAELSAALGRLERGLDAGDCRCGSFGHNAVEAD